MSLCWLHINKYIYTILYLSIDGTQNSEQTHCVFHTNYNNQVPIHNFVYIFFLLLGATVLFLYIILALCQWNFVIIFFLVNFFFVFLMIYKKGVWKWGEWNRSKQGFLLCCHNIITH